MTKLVTILARELEEWPKGDCIAITQDFDGRLNTTDRGCTPKFIQYSLMWSANGSSYLSNPKTEKYPFVVDIATDYATAIVTRQMWKKERAKLQSRKEWQGPQDGLPPYGTECEFRHPDFGWTGCTVVGSFRNQAVCAPNGGKYYGGSAEDFRPIQSDRDKWIESALKECTDHISKMQLGKIYDAGLAKLPD